MSRQIEFALEKVLEVMRGSGRPVLEHEMEAVVRDALGKNESTDFVRKVATEVTRRLEAYEPGRDGQLRRLPGGYEWEED